MIKIKDMKYIRHHIKTYENKVSILRLRCYFDIDSRGISVSYCICCLFDFLCLWLLSV
jgi:hypothetical protein